MIEYDVEQGSQDWFHLRLGRPTASEFKRILTAKKMEYSKGAAGYIDQIIGEALHAADGRYPPNVESYTSRAMDDGAANEAEARFWYVKETGLAVRRIGFVTTDDGRFGCSPDGLVDPDGGLELKCPQAKAQMQTLRVGGVPLQYLAQVHGALVVTGRKWWDFLSYCHGCPQHLVRVYPNEFTTRLREYLERFWTEYAEAMEKLKALRETT